MYSLALQADGTVVPWGNDDLGANTVPARLSSGIAVTAGYQHSVALVAETTNSSPVVFFVSPKPGRRVGLYGSLCNSSARGWAADLPLVFQCHEPNHRRRIGHRNLEVTDFIARAPRQLENRRSRLRCQGKRSSDRPSEVSRDCPTNSHSAEPVRFRWPGLEDRGTLRQDKIQTNPGTTPRGLRACHTIPRGWGAFARPVESYNSGR